MDGRKTVLICEDDPVQLKTLVAAFEQGGYRTISAPGPGPAMQGVRERRPDAVVTDVQLEQGNGFELVDNLRRSGIDVPVVMVSASATETTRERARAAGVLNFLEKPFSPRDLVERVGEIVKYGRKRPLGGRVLVVEDEAVSRALLTETLFQAGAEVAVADTGERAVDFLRSADPPVDIVLADFHLPGLEGGRLISELRKAAPGTFVAMITGEAVYEEIQAGFKAGASALIRKPFSPKEVVAFIDRNLERAQEMREAARRSELAQKEPRLKRFRRWVHSYLHARQGSSKQKRVLAACVTGIALVVGLAAASTLNYVMSTIDHYKNKADQVLDAAIGGAGGSKEDVEFQRWYLKRKLEMDKEVNEATKDYYRRQMEAERAPRLSPREPR